MTTVNSSNYQQLALRTMAPQQSILDRLVAAGPKIMQLYNALVGLQNDCGELAEPVKRLIEYGKTDALDKVNMKEEVGDVLWRLAQICDALGFSIEDCMQANVEKLAVRYGDKFSDFKANNRNLEAERAALEGLKVPAETGCEHRVVAMGSRPNSVIGTCMSCGDNILVHPDHKAERAPNIVKENPTVDKVEYKQIGHGFVEEKILPPPQNKEALPADGWKTAFMIADWLEGQMADKARAQVSQARAAWLMAQGKTHV